MADESMTIPAPLPYDPSEFEPEPGSRPLIDRGNDADFIVKTGTLGGKMESQLVRGDKVSKADLNALGVITPAEFKRLIDVNAVFPLRAVDLTTAPNPAPEKKGK